MKALSLSLLLSLALLSNTNVRADDGWSGNVNLLLGSKGMSDRDWLATAHGEVGILLDFGRSEWPVNIAIDMLRSRGKFSGGAWTYVPGFGWVLDYVEEEVTTRELDLGIRHYFDLGTNMHPYFAGGLALVNLEADTRTNSGAVIHDSGKGTGIWLNGGIKWELDAFNIGFDVRVTAADVAVDGGDVSGGGGHAGLILGYHW